MMDSPTGIRTSGSDNERDERERGRERSREHERGRDSERERERERDMDRDREQDSARERERDDQSSQTSSARRPLVPRSPHPPSAAPPSAHVHYRSSQTRHSTLASSGPPGSPVSASASTSPPRHRQTGQGQHSARNSQHNGQTGHGGQRHRDSGHSGSASDSRRPPPPALALVAPFAEIAADASAYVSGAAETSARGRRFAAGLAELDAQEEAQERQMSAVFERTLSQTGGDVDRGVREARQTYDRVRTNADAHLEDAQRRVQDGVDDLERRADDMQRRAEDVQRTVSTRLMLGAGDMLGHAMERRLNSFVGGGGGGGGGHANGGPPRGSLYGGSGFDATSASKRPLTLGERLKPTLDMAIYQREHYARKARITGISLNFAIGAQVLLGALTTGLSAATSGKSSRIVVSVFGGASTLVASYLARTRGSEEPERSKIRTRDLDGFIRECESAILDRGAIVGHFTEDGRRIRDENEEIIERLRQRLDDLLGGPDKNMMGSPEKRPRV